MRRGGLLLALLAVASMTVLGQRTDLYESFELAWSGGAPAGWTKTNVVGSVNWEQKSTPLTGQVPPSTSSAHHKLRVAWFPSNSAAGTTTRLETPTFDFSAATVVRLRFFYVNTSGNDSLRIRSSTDNGASWTTVATLGTTPTAAWQQNFVVLPNLAGRTNAKIGFEAVSDGGTSDIWIDRVVVQYPVLTLREIQFMPLDSLIVADSVQGTSLSRIRLQASPYDGDTVSVRALCVVQPKILTFTAGGWTMLLYDSSATTEWGAIFVRVNAPADTTQALIDGFLNVERGDIITMTGLVSEFPNTITLMNSVTQLQPIPGIAVGIVGSSGLPQPINKTIGDFYRGIFPASGRAVRYSTGEPFESMIVRMTDLTVDFRVNTGRGTFSAVDGIGNQITNYDASKFYTLGHGGTLPQPGDSIWATLYPPVGARIDTIIGYMTTVSSSENPRGYRISPVFRPDLTIGFVLPSITTHRRNPVVVPPDSAGRISVRVTQQTGGYPIASVQLIYALNNAPFNTLTMTFQASDTTYNASIPQQAANTFVNYFIKAIDNQGNSAILASSAFGGAASDTSKGFFFYTVLNRPLTIHDLQYTPYLNGRTAYLGAENVSISGVVTADTANIMVSPLNTGGTSSWYMQAGNAPWNGLWFVGTLDSLGHLRNGDSVTIRGSVTEQFDVTRVQNVNNRPTIHTTGNPQPTSVVLPTSTFGPTVGNGTPSAEQYEGMLVRFNNVTVTDVNPVFSDPTEFAVSDGTGEVLVRRDGTHNYSNVPADTITGKTILYQGTQISFLQGVIYYSFNRYKITPRKNSDFGVVSGVRIDRDPVVPASYSLAQNYPNPFNPSTSIEYTLPSSENVTLKIYNLLGQEVKTLVNDTQAPGKYTVRFDASSLSSGVYFYRLQAGKFIELKKMLLVK